MKTQAATRDLGLAISGLAEGMEFPGYVESGVEGEECELVKSGWFAIDHVDASDPDNLVIHLDNGQAFTLRIIAGEN